MCDQLAHALDASTLMLIQMTVCQQRLYALKPKSLPTVTLDHWRNPSLKRVLVDLPLTAMDPAMAVCVPRLPSQCKMHVN